MEAVDPARATPASKPWFRHPLVALGLIGLPVAGSVLLAPGIADAVTPGVTFDYRTVATVRTTDVDELVEAFFAAGYTVDDAAVLAERWGVGDPYRAKAKAGKFLARGVPLGASSFADPTADAAFDADGLVDVFLASGYTYEDAELLAENWGTDIGEAKVKAGSELKTVGVLPFVDPLVDPVADPASSADGTDEARFDAFFDAGYDYDDAVALADQWGVGDFVDAKLKAGSLLLAGRSLPVEPGAS